MVCANEDCGESIWAISQGVCFQSGVSLVSEAKHRRWTVGEMLKWLSEKLDSLGVVDARVDAEHLLAFALRCRRMDLYLQHDRLLEADARDGIRELVKRRLAREPVAYIEGRRGFHALDLELQVDSRVLIPRPDTEHLVDWALEFIEEVAKANSEQDESRISVLDIGTGSGAIALALKHSMPSLCIAATDISTEALEVAKSNATRLGLHIDFSCSDLFEHLSVPKSGWSVITANLPYISSGDLEELAPEVRDYEPRLALDGGVDGLAVIGRILADCLKYRALAQNGALFLEVGFDQAESVQSIAEKLGYSEVQLRRDYSGVARVVRCRTM